MDSLFWTMDQVPAWLWIAAAVGLVIALMVRNQRQAYAYGVWDAIHSPNAPAVKEVLNTVERRAWRDGEVANLFATNVQLTGTTSKRQHLL
ncbi:MAG TPA: hypothetical protein VM554_00455 [Acidisarcina sp.]|nr:hypothetical protein [Acidisarcina sp.]